MSVSFGPVPGDIYCNGHDRLEQCAAKATVKVFVYECETGKLEFKYDLPEGWTNSLSGGWEGSEYETSHYCPKHSLKATAVRAP